MEGPLGVVDPDYVEQETGNFWRSLYKSEKQFNQVPTAQKIAKKVCVSFRCIAERFSLLEILWHSNYILEFSIQFSSFGISNVI